VSQWYRGGFLSGQTLAVVGGNRCASLGADQISLAPWAGEVIEGLVADSIHAAVAAQA
jgi:hypothetical protein